MSDGSEVLRDINLLNGVGGVCCTEPCNIVDGGDGDGGGGVDGGGGGDGGGGVDGGGGDGGGGGVGGDGNQDCSANFEKRITAPEKVDENLNIPNFNLNTDFGCSSYWRYFNNHLKQKAIDEWNANPTYRTAGGDIVPISQHPTQKNKACWDPNPVKKFSRKAGTICNGKCYYDYWYEARPTIKQVQGCVTPTPTSTITLTPTPTPTLPVVCTAWRIIEVVYLLAYEEGGFENGSPVGLPSSYGPNTEEYPGLMELQFYCDDQWITQESWISQIGNEDHILNTY
jgi:hypothetical protein